MCLIPLFSGIVFGANQSKIDGMLADLISGAQTTNSFGSGFAVLIIIGLFLSGWSILPFFISNAVIIPAGGVAVSYYYSCFFAIVPVVVTGVMYIVGAYSKRAKTVRKQEIADRQAAAEASKEKKINYGGLPGTKPKKRK